MNLSASEAAGSASAAATEMPATPTKRPWAARSAAVAWAVLVLGLCWIPRSGLPVEETAPAFLFIPNLDKAIHAGLFGVLGLLWVRADVARRWTVRIVIGGILLAIVSELGQAMPFVNRDAGLDDTVADIVGLLLGVGCGRYLFSALRRPA